MTMKRYSAEADCFGLLREWCGALLALQVDLPHEKTLDGGILCPACRIIHGRCIDAVYPLMCMADRTGEEKYLSAAKRLFAWSANMRNDDGSIRNDAKSPWRGVTVFFAIALHDALQKHGHLLDASEREVWRARLSEMGEWLYANLAVGAHAYINYYAANACAMALLGKLFGRESYLARAKELAAYCFKHVSGNGLLYGEGSPHDAVSPKGCPAIDAGGYNVEESLPSLTRYALTTGDSDARKQCERLWRAHIDWMLPDGAWDDSVGTRTFKWTYWGSRTSDGCQDALFALGRDDPLFAEAAVRNLRLLRESTHGGLLCGGRDCFEHGDGTCVHHTFCHAKALAGTLDSGLYAFERVPLPADVPARLRYYAENDTYRLSEGGWRMDVTAYDYPHKRGDHASGGSVSLLWHRDCGAVLASGMLDYALIEPMNQQLPLRGEEQVCPCPRIESEIGGKRCGQHYDFAAVMRAEAADGCVRLHVDASLCDSAHRPADGGCTLDYTLTAHGLRIEGGVPPLLAQSARFVLPVFSDAVKVTVLRGVLAGAAKPVFCLSPGFAGKEYTALPDADGRFTLEITV